MFYVKDMRKNFLLFRKNKLFFGNCPERIRIECPRRQFLIYLRLKVSSFVRFYCSIAVQGLIFSFLCIFSVSAEAGFHDIIFLKNGKQYSGIKVVLVADQIAITTEKGESSVFKSEDVSEIKLNALRADKGIALQSPKNPSGAWGLQGRMTWSEAKAKCSSAGMRLPTSLELSDAYRAGIKDSWIQEMSHTWYWSSDEISSESAYYLGLGRGSVYKGSKSLKNAVRCTK